MVKRIFIFTIILGWLSHQLFAQTNGITIFVDSKEKHVISPYIYGTNTSINDFGIKSIRQGGNRWTGYNWENNLSNSGTDLNNMSDSYLTPKISLDSSSLPGSAALYYYETARTFNQFFLTTVPMAGKVAKVSGNVYSSSNIYWNEVVPQKNNPFSLSPDIKDEFVYVDEYVNYLVSKFKTAKNGGIQAYGLDNEPDLWKNTHPYIHPYNTKINELISKTVSTSLAIKHVDSTALIFGPSMSGWYGCNNFNGLDNAWSSVSSSSMSPYYKEWFLSLYLDSMNYYSNKYKKRIVDVVNVHWYPEARSMENQRIVNLKGGSEPLTKSAIKERIQAPRSLWDSTYSEIGPLGSGICLLERIKKSINKYNQGTKIGITEYRYGTEDHYSGGLALADVLGVFGKEDVFYASKWFAKGETMFLKYSKSAFDLYTNYDGKYSMFGDVSIPTKNSSNDTLSSFASIDKDEKLHVIVVNKIPNVKEVNINLSGGYYISAGVYGFDSVSSTIQKRDSIKSKAPFNTCKYSLPAYSALHFVFDPMPKPKIISASTDTSDDKKIKVVFSQSLQKSVLSGNDISVMNKDGVLMFNSVMVSDSLLTVNLSESIKLNDTTLYLTVLKELTNKSGINVKIEDKIKIYNNLIGSLPQLMVATTEKTSNIINLKFSKNITSADIASFEFSYNDIPKQIESYTIDQNIIKIKMIERFKRDDKINGELNNNDGIVFKDKSKIASLEKFIINNMVETDDLIIDTALLYNSGFNIALNCNKLIATNSSLSNIQVIVNGILRPFTGMIINAKIYLTMSSKIDYNDIIQVKYIDNGDIKSFDDGYLSSVVKNVYNNLPKPPDRVVVPAKIEGENFYYALGKSSIVNATVKVVKLEIGGESAYRINVPKDGNYTLILNRSSFENMGVSITIGGFDTVVMLAKTNTNYKQYGIELNLSTGDYTLLLKPIKPESKYIEIDYIEIKEGVEIPNCEYLSGMVLNKGTYAIINFDSYLKSAVTLNDFELKVDGVKKDITKISQKENIVTLYFEDTIYKKQICEITLTNDLLYTENGALVQPFTKVLTNNSSVLTSVENIYNDYFLKYHNGKIFTNLPSDAQFRIYNILGVEIYSGKISEVCEMQEIFKSGYYSVVAYKNARVIYKDKILVVR